MAVELLHLHTCFLNKTEKEVDVLTFDGFPLIKKDRTYMGSNQTSVVYSINNSDTYLFLLIFDADEGGKAVVQRTYSGHDTNYCYNRLMLRKNNYLPNFETSGFCVSAPKFGNVLIEYIDDFGTPCVMASINI